MKYFGKVLGIIIGLLSGIGIWGIIIGIVVGYIADKITNIQTNKQDFNNKKYKNAFINITFEVMGHIAKSKGIITNEDIKMACLFMDEMKLNIQECKLAKESFKIGKKFEYPLKNKIKKLKNMSFLKSNLIKKFLEIQIKTAFFDGYLHSNEKTILYIIAEELGISSSSFSYFLHAVQNNAKNFRYNSNYANQNEHSYYNQNNILTLDQACHILGIKADDNKFTIKRAYKKLMSKYHPDKVISKNLSYHDVEKAKIKTQNIRLAYDFIKKIKKFK